MVFNNIHTTFWYKVIEFIVYFVYKNKQYFVYIVAKVYDEFDNLISKGGVNVAEYHITLR